MPEKKVSREEFERLREASLELAIRLRERDRHGRGGTTLGEMWATDTFADGFIALFTDPEYIRRKVAENLETWLGERDGKYSGEGWLEKEASGVSIAKLGKMGRYTPDRFPTPAEVGRRAARAPSMTEAKAKNRVDLLRENAKLCLDLADAFEKRLKAREQHTTSSVIPGRIGVLDRGRPALTLFTSFR